MLTAARILDKPFSERGVAGTVMGYGLGIKGLLFGKDE